MAVGLKGRMNGYLNQRWPDWFKPHLVDFDSRIPLGPFGGHHTLTQAEDIHLVPTPGHSRGHLSVTLSEDDLSIMFAGDASYTAELLRAQSADGIGPDPQGQQETHRKILVYATSRRTERLPGPVGGAQAKQ